MEHLYRIIQPQSERIVSNQLVALVEEKLNGLGILSRVFGRVKSIDSIVKKITDRIQKGEPYGDSGKKMQDFFGIRVVVYFADDVAVARDVVANLFDHHSDSITEFSGEQFGPVRCNIVYHLPDDLEKQSNALRVLNELDKTLEVQFRTVLSEGWHEVEHDLRYKRKKSWQSHEDLGRVINAILATLEGSDWTLLKVFDDLSHRHYRNGDYLEMVHAKFRLRFSSGRRIDELWQLLSTQQQLAKELYRIDRKDFLNKLIDLQGSLPITPENIVFLSNRFFIQNQNLQKLEPPQVRAVMDRWEAQQIANAPSIPI